MESPPVQPRQVHRPLDSFSSTVLPRQTFFYPILEVMACLEISRVTSTSSRKEERQTFLQIDKEATASGIGPKHRLHTLTERQQYFELPARSFPSGRSFPLGPKKDGNKNRDNLDSKNFFSKGCLIAILNMRS